MSTEIDEIETEVDSLKRRVAALESRFPAICPDPTGEGSAWQGEAARSVPVGWVRGGGQGERRKTTKGWASAEESKSILYGQSISPDPSIPWGEDYDAIIPEEAKEGDEFRDDYRDCQWVICKDKGAFSGRFLASVPWRRRRSPAPAEPAPGSDAEHPPVGYVLVPLTSNDPIGSEWIVWSYRGPWRSVSSENVDLQRSRSRYAMARPIPANEGDSQKAELSDKIAESVVQDLQQACYDRDELRATVERLTADNAELSKTNRSYHMTITDLNDRLRMVREAAR